MSRPKREPTQDHFSHREVAEIMRLSEGRVSQLIEAGVIPQSPDATYPKVEVLLAILEWLRPGNDISGLKKEKLAKELRVLEIAVNKAEGTAFDSADVHTAWADRILKAREKLLIIPGLIAPRFAYFKSEQEAQAAILQAIEDALTELSKPVQYTDHEAPEKSG